MEENLDIYKHNLIEELKLDGIRDQRVLDAIAKVPRELFIAENLRRRAYENCALPIDSGQTISQPYIVALMTEAAQIGPKSHVLEIGTGSGYQAAVLGEICQSVYTLEIIDELAQSAAKQLKTLGYGNVHVKSADGYSGWEDEGPFDAILVTAAARSIPKPLLKQLKDGGRLIIPIKSVFYQDLTLIVRKEAGYSEHVILPVTFVPMTGEVNREK